MLRKRRGGEGSGEVTPLLGPFRRDRPWTGLPVHTKTGDNRVVNTRTQQGVCTNVHEHAPTKPAHKRYPLDKTKPAHMRSRTRQDPCADTLGTLGDTRGRTLARARLYAGVAITGGAVTRAGGRAAHRHGR